MNDRTRAARLPFSADEDRIVRENYGQLSVREIAGLIGRTEKAIYNYVSREGITKRDYREWTEDDLAELRELYEEMTAPQIALLLGRSADSVRQRVTRMDLGKAEAARERMRVTLRAFRQHGRSTSAGFPHADGPVPSPLQWPADSPVARKTFITASTVHGYFTEVNRVDQAYALGLLTADGNVDSKHPRVQLGLVARDMRAVEFVRDRLNPAARLCRLADGRMTLQVTSRQMVADLAKVRILPRKSRIVAWPWHLGDLQRPFLLGYFDGDGSGYLHRDRRGRELPGWNACSGSEQFLIDMRAYIREATGVKLQEIQHREGADLWQVSVTGLAAVVLDEWLHQEGIGLARKRFPESALAYYRD